LRSIEQLDKHQQRLNMLDQSLDYSERAYALFRTLDEVANQSQLDICITMHSDNGEDAVRCFQQAAELFRSMGEWGGDGMTLCTTWLMIVSPFGQIASA